MHACMCGDSLVLETEHRLSIRFSSKNLWPLSHPPVLSGSYITRRRTYLKTTRKYLFSVSQCVELICAAGGSGGEPLEDEEGREPTSLHRKCVPLLSRKPQNTNSLRPLLRMTPRASMSASPVWCLRSVSPFKNTQRKPNKVFFLEDAFYIALVQLLPDISPIIDPVCYRNLPLIDWLSWYVSLAGLELTT